MLVVDFRPAAICQSIKQPFVIQELLSAHVESMKESRAEIEGFLREEFRRKKVGAEWRKSVEQVADDDAVICQGVRHGKKMLHCITFYFTCCYKTKY